MRMLRRAAARSFFAVLGPRRFNRVSAIVHAAKYATAPVAIDPVARGVVDAFHVLSYGTGALHDTYWMGRPIQKSPLDCWTYQELIHDLRPDVIIETGTYMGGSALFFAQMCDLVGHGQVLTVDIERRAVVDHPRVRQLIGDSTGPEILAAVGRAVQDARCVMVVLDSDHSAAHVLRELRAYARFVTSASYLVVEDTNVNGHPVLLEHGPGPMEALREFLASDDHFVTDRTREKFLLTYFPEGWLHRVRDATAI